MNKEQWLKLYYQFKQTRFSRFFRSVRVAIGIILLIVIASILGTIIIQNGQPTVYIQKYGETGFFWIRFFGLNNVYHVWWYKFLLVILTVATITCLVSRVNMKIVRSGSLFVHINIITILVGIVLARFGEKGFLQVFEGEKNGQMIVEKGFVKNPKTGKMERDVAVRDLPFEVALNDFYISRYKVPQERLLVLDQAGKVIKDFPIEPGKLIKMPSQKLGLTVLDVYPHAHIEEKVVRDPDGNFFPAVNLSVESPQGKGEGWLFSDQGDYLLSPDQTMMIVYRWFETEIEMQEAIREFEADTDDPRHKIPHLFQVVSGRQVEPRVLHFEKGKFVENHIFQNGAPVLFEQVKTSFFPKEFLEKAKFQTTVINKSEEYINPAIRLAVGSPDAGIQARWLFANQQDPHPTTDLPYQFYYSVDFPIKEYVSQIKILDQGKEVFRKSLRVNHPAKYKGYRLYQASYDQENGKWTGIQVTRDPGMPLVFVGFVGMMIGLILMFYVNPFFNKSKAPENEEIDI